MKRLFLTTIFSALFVLPSAAQEPSGPPSGGDPLSSIRQPEIAEQAYLFANGLAPVTDAQIDSAELCIELLARREPPHRNALTPDCALAFDALALAEEPLTDEALETVAALARQNASLLLAEPVIDAYFDRVPLVGPVRFSDSPLESVDISYQFTGNERFDAYELTFTDLDGTPRLTGYEVHQGIDEPIPTPDMAYQATPTRFEQMAFDADLVRALPEAFTNFVPVRSIYGDDRCDGYNATWRVVLTYTDGTEVTALSLGGDALEVDGPWGVYAEGERYFQYSHDIGRAMYALMASLDAPLGSRDAIACEENIPFERGYFAQSYIFMG